MRSERGGIVYTGHMRDGDVDDPIFYISYKVLYKYMKVKPEESLKIENIVASAKVADTLDLQMINEKIQDAEYNKKRFPGVVLRMQDPKIAALVFGSGKFRDPVQSMAKGLHLRKHLCNLFIQFMDRYHSYPVKVEFLTKKRPRATFFSAKS